MTNLIYEAWSLVIIAEAIPFKSSVELLDYWFLNSVFIREVFETKSMLV